MTSLVSPIKKNNFIEGIALIGFICLILYPSYRYPFQINFSGTSPGYSDTPLLLQLIKYIFATFVCAVIIAFPVKSKFYKKAGSLIAILLILIYIPDFFRFSASTNLEYIEPIYWVVVACIMSIGMHDLHPKKVDKIFFLLLLYSVFYELVQVLSLFLCNRLPALAYENTISIRFGSFLDDPNGFSILCFLFLGWSLKLSNTWHRWLLVTTVTVMLILAQSLTSLAILALLFLVYLLSGSVFRNNTLPLMALAISSATIFFYYSSDITEILNNFMSSKQGSVSEHADMASDVLPNLAISLVFGSYSYFIHESWWYRSAVNAGLILTVLSLFVHISLLSLIYKNYRDATDLVDKRVLFSVLNFGLAYVLGSFNLPLPTVFPVNFVFYFLAFSALNRYKSIVRL